MLPRAASAIRQVLVEADLLFSVGADLFALSLPYDDEPVPPHLPIVHVDTDPWELGKNYPTQVALIGDPRATLAELKPEIEARLTTEGQARARERLEAVRAAKAREIEEVRARARREARRVPPTPLAAIQAIAEVLPLEAVVIDEAVSSAAGLRALLPSEDSKSFFGLRGGAVGWGLPGAVGVKLALPDRPVVALVGDGSALYTCQTLWTAARYGIAVTFIILNNASYRILKQRLYAMKGLAAQADHCVGMDLDDPHVDFMSLARTFGLEGERVREVGEIGPAVMRALTRSGPTLIDIELDRSFGE
jgi:benzoylformate decarboxylase